MLLIMLELKGEQYHLQDSNITAYRFKRMSALLLKLSESYMSKFFYRYQMCAKHLKGTICEVDKSVKNKQRVTQIHLRNLNMFPSN